MYKYVVKILFLPLDKIMNVAYWEYYALDDNINQKFNNEWIPRSKFDV